MTRAAHRPARPQPPTRRTPRQQALALHAAAGRWELAASVLDLADQPTAAEAVRLCVDELLEIAEGRHGWIERRPFTDDGLDG
jgi:hypothetical protein